MNLEQFIEETFKGIINGVKRSQKFAKEHGASVNPSVIGTNLHRGGSQNRPAPADRHGFEMNQMHSIDFDIAVTTTEGDDTRGGGSIHIASAFSIGGEKSKHIEASTISRIRFTLPMEPPAQWRESETGDR